MQQNLLMTSLAFILGILLISNGTDSDTQNLLGTGMLGGIIAATTLSIYFVPVFLSSYVDVSQINISLAKLLAIFH